MTLLFHYIRTVWVWLDHVYWFDSWFGLIRKNNHQSSDLDSNVAQILIDIIL